MVFVVFHIGSTVRSFEHESPLKCFFDDATIAFDKLTYKLSNQVREPVLRLGNPAIRKPYSRRIEKLILCEKRAKVFTEDSTEYHHPITYVLNELQWNTGYYSSCFDS